MFDKFPGFDESDSTFKVEVSRIFDSLEGAKSRAKEFFGQKLVWKFRGGGWGMPSSVAGFLQSEDKDPVSVICRMPKKGG